MRAMSSACGARRRSRAIKPLDQRAEVEQQLELGPSPGSSVWRSSRPRPAAQSGSTKAPPLRPRWTSTYPCAASRCSASRIVVRLMLEHRGQLALGGQSLARDELAEGDRGDDPVGDLLPGVAHAHRFQDGRRSVAPPAPAGAGSGAASRTPPRLAYQATTNRASVLGAVDDAAARRPRRCRGCRSARRPVADAGRGEPVEVDSGHRSCFPRRPRAGATPCAARWAAASDASRSSTASA